MPSAGLGVRYTVTPADLHAHLYTVVLDIAQPCAAGQQLAMPAWLRGSYKIRDFARHVVDISARCEDAPVAIERLDKSTLVCAPCAGPLRVTCRVHAHDASVRTAFLDATRGFFNTSSLCWRVVGQSAAACEFVLERPAGSPAGWIAVTTLPAVAVDAHGFGRYRADDYETLIDHPFALGPQQIVAFEVDGIPHRLALAGRCTPDVDRLRTDLAAVCAAQRTLFGHAPRLDAYAFLCTVLPGGHGGLEHRSSAALACARGNLPQPGDPSQTPGYRDFLALVSHEYFHQWNVKRITPQRFAESPLQAEAYTQDLWAYEGVTSYYDDLFLLRSGRVAAATWLDLLAAAATRVERTPGRRLQTLADASFEAWTKHYQPDANAPNARISYYTKGALVALCLDLTLRRDAAVSLDDVMRALWQRHGATGTPVPERGLERLATEISGLDLAAFFDTALRSTQDLPLAPLLADFGVTAKLRVAHAGEDRGGRGAGATIRHAAGLRWSRDGLRVTHVLSGSAAEDAGLAPGDVPVALDGLRVSGRSWQPQLDALHTGAAVALHYFRGDELFTTRLEVTPAPQDTWAFTLATACTGQAAVRRKAWLGV
ncbi:MAG: M61 family peptidase [Nevskiaceae bacterium]|nr:MAG: M61 family peptidase [Nevskiaceae bacterium]TBR73742.1 MAG: M61 family peptidase [Nevskiaceae bacterium]